MKKKKKLILRLKKQGILIDLSWQGFQETGVQNGSELVRFLLKWLLCVFIIVCFILLQIDMEMILICFMIVIFHC